MVATPRASEPAGSPLGSGSPPNRISPAVGSTAPETHLISVDLPAPFGPSRQWTSPSTTSRSTPCRALTPGYSLTRPRTSRIAVIRPPSGGGAARASRRHFHRCDVDPAFLLRRRDDGLGDACRAQAVP